MWSRRLPSLNRTRKSSSPSRSPAGRAKNADPRSKSHTRISRADTLVAPPVEETNDNPLGLSVLYSPSESPTVDIIFIHGLGGGSIKTWCKNGDRNLCWPRNWLPSEPGFGSIRLLSFGYDAAIISRTKTVSTVSDFAKSLLAELKYGKDDAMEDLGIGKARSLASFLIFPVLNLSGPCNIRRTFDGRVGVQEGIPTSLE